MTTFLVDPLEVKLSAPDSFLIVKETLTRIGIASKKNKTLFQSCHILHKRGKYYIMHFKELFHLDGKATTLDPMDIPRRNTIAFLLEQFGMVTIVTPNKFSLSRLPPTAVTIISHREKSEWTLIPKYTIGVKKV